MNQKIILKPCDPLIIINNPKFKLLNTEIGCEIESNPYLMNNKRDILKLSKNQLRKSS